MAHYKPLKNVRGIQTGFTRFRFVWDAVDDDYGMHFLWIYKIDEQNNPNIIKYANCFNNSVDAGFQYNYVSLNEVRKLAFLIFLSDQQVAPSNEEMRKMGETSEYVCDVCCGNGEIEWKWNQGPQGSFTLLVKSNKEVSEGILYYEYLYGNKNFRYGLPGEIRQGENVYENIYFPALPQVPQLKANVPNLSLSSEGSRSGGGGQKKPGHGGIFDLFKKKK